MAIISKTVAVVEVPLPVTEFIEAEGIETEKSLAVSSVFVIAVFNVNTNVLVEPVCVVPGALNELTITGGRLSIAAVVLVAAAAGALLTELPPERTLVAFNLNLNEPFVFVGGVALTIIPVPAVAVAEIESNTHPV